jgi:hypothetical protein
MTDHSILVEISSDQQNATEQVLNQLRKEASDAKRYGVDINIRRVNASELQELEGFGHE